MPRHSTTDHLLIGLSDFSRARRVLCVGVLAGSPDVVRWERGMLFLVPEPAYNALCANRHTYQTSTT